MSASAKALFLSYASQDAAAARRIAEALRAAGVEVWFDQNELVGGDAWDAKIRKQIADCALFVPVISAATQARLKGYFRIEWKLAARRTHAMATAKAFLLPVVIDDTRDAEAHVPDEFREVQWTRLKDGETTPPFESLVKKLLTGPNVGASVDDARGRRQEVPRQAIRPPSRKVYAFLALAACMFAGATGWWILRDRRPAARVVTAPQSETQRLAGLARALIYKAGAARTELEAAEELCKKAAKLDPTDAEVLAIWSQACSWFVFHGFDASPGKKEAAGAMAAKALQLAPESFEARFAQAFYLVRGSGLLSAEQSLWAGEILRDLLREREDEPRSLLTLSFLHSRALRFDEARATLGRLAKNPAFAATAWGELGWVELAAGDYAAAEAAVDRATSSPPLWRNLILKTLLAVEWRGDLELALATRRQLPASVQLEDVGAISACYIHALRHDPDRMLQALDAVPRNWLHTGGYDGPKAVWVALAHEQRGEIERAEAQWRFALKLIEGALAERPADMLQLQKAYVLAALGEQVEAGKALKLVDETAAPKAGPWIRHCRYVLTLIRLGKQDAALDYLEKTAWLTAAVLRYEPQLDPLRKLPRFQALQAKAAAPSLSSPAVSSLSVPGGRGLGEAGPPPTDAKSVAVLAFANLSDDRGNEYFSDGISEELLNVLARIPGLKVSARTSAFSFKGKDVPIPEIARQLGVAYVVEGSVRKQGDKVRITAQLIKAADGFHVWSDTFTRDLKDIFAVQDEIAGLIAQQLSLRLGDATRVAKAVNPEAHRLVLEGRHYFALRGEANFARADEAFRAAIAISPDLAVAYAGRAEVASQRWRYQELAGLAAPGSQLEEVRMHAGRALELDPGLAEPHAAFSAALLDSGRLDEAEAAAARGLAANPNYSSLYLWQSHIHSARGRLDLALNALQRATELDPLAFLGIYLRAAYWAPANRYAEGVMLADRAAALRGAPFVPLEGERAIWRSMLGRHEEAMAIARKNLTDPELLTLGWWSMGEALWVLRRGGADAEAASQGERLLAQLDRENYLRGYVLCGLGRFEAGLPLLRRLPTITRVRLYYHPMFDPVRETPAFRQMIRELGVVSEYAVARETLARLIQEAKK